LNPTAITSATALSKSSLNLLFRFQHGTIACYFGKVQGHVFQ
jgi:hypothetical protein